MRTTKSPTDVLVWAHLVGEGVLRSYWHKHAPKKFTVPQLFACLALKEFMKADYRKVWMLLRECPELGASIGLNQIPHFTTLQQASARLLEGRRVQRLLDQTITLGKQIGLLPSKSDLAAVDGTGLESTTASRYFVKRCQKTDKKRVCTTYKHFPKIGVVTDCKSHLVLAVVHDRGPSPDVRHYRRALDQARNRLAITTLLADAGYDSEASHEYAREQCGVRSLIPAKIGRVTSKPPKGRYRRLMKSRIHNTRYNQRVQVETTISMYKRLLGSALRARKTSQQRREASLKAITLNIMILWWNMSSIQSHVDSEKDFRRLGLV